MAKSSTKTTKSGKNTVSKTKKVAVKTTSKKDNLKEDTTVKDTKKASASKTVKKSTTKSSSSKEKSTAKTTKKVSTKNTTSKNVAVSKKTTTRAKKSKSKTVANTIEYYDLPNTYNQTTVKLLFQTPRKLFVYWEISEADKQKYFDENGNDFFEKTTPFLVVKNKSKNYSFEVEINDFANSWYFDVPDSNCEYEVELIRRHKVTNIPTYITSSNELEVPNNHILFEQNRREIFFKNVKNNNVFSKSIVNLQFMKHLGNVYNLNSFYRRFYTENELYEISNPTSN